MEQSISDFNGINTFTNSFNTPDGNIIHCVNLESEASGSRRKREGYTTFLNNPDSAQVNSLFSWMKDDGVTLFNYRASGSALYYSVQGTGNWTLASNGTIANASHVSGAVLDNTLVVGDGSGTMKYTTDGTTFSDIAAAPVGGHDPVEFQGRIYAMGTNSFMFYSTTGTASDWTSDSSSVLVGGAGKLGVSFKASDRLITTKNSGLMHRWDGDSLVDMATKLGPSSPYSVGEVEDFRLYLNRLGIFITNGGKPQLLSNPVQRQIYNASNTGILGTQFDSSPGVVHQYQYLVNIGTVTDNFTAIKQPDAILAYDYLHNEFYNLHYSDIPTAYHSFQNTSGSQTLIFGDATGQCYQLGGNSDNGKPIDTSMVVLLHGNLPHVRKDFGYIELWASPAARAKVQYAIQDIIVSNDLWYRTGPKIWKELGDLTGGYTLFRFPPETRGRLLYLKLYEASTSAPWEIFSVHYTFEPRPL